MAGNNRIEDRALVLWVERVKEKVLFHALSNRCNLLRRLCENRCLVVLLLVKLAKDLGTDGHTCATRRCFLDHRLLVSGLELADGILLTITADACVFRSNLILQLRNHLAQEIKFCVLGFVGRLWIAIVALEVLGHEGDLLYQHVITYRVLDAALRRL